jgi:hypothetical protein
MDVVQHQLVGKAGGARVEDAVGVPVTKSMLHENVDAFLGAAEERLGIHRVHLLVIGCANLESYLQEVIKLHVAAMGYADGPDSLTEVGNAIAKPVLGSSTLPEMIKYAGHLLAVDFGSMLGDIRRAYRIRCAAAHQGGYVSAKTLQQVPDLKLPVGSVITISWTELRRYLKAADRIAGLIDSRVANDESRAYEAESILWSLKERGELPLRKGVWNALARTYGVQHVSRKLKREVEARVYGAAF